LLVVKHKKRGKVGYITRTTTTTRKQEGVDAKEWNKHNKYTYMQHTHGNIYIIYVLITVTRDPTKSTSMQGQE